jgi:hypothetical protein
VHHPVRTEVLFSFFRPAFITNGFTQAGFTHRAGTNENLIGGGNSKTGAEIINVVLLALARDVIFLQQLANFDNTSGRP